MKRNIFILLIVASILIVFSTLIFASGTIDVKDYIKGKFPVIFNIYLSSLGELDEYEKEFIDLLQNLPEEEQKNFAKEVHSNGFSKDMLEKMKRGNYYLRDRKWGCERRNWEILTFTVRCREYFKFYRIC